MVRRDEVGVLTIPAPSPRGLTTALCAVGVAALVFADLAFAGLHTAELTVAAIAGIAALVWAASRPGQALNVLLVFLPLQTAALAWIYKLGMPASVVRNMGYFKDVVVGGICLAAAMHQRSRPERARRPFDAIDWFALIYVGIATAYLLIPMVVHGALGGQPTRVRLTAWRLDALFVIVMFAARRLPFTPEQLRRSRGVLIGVASFLLIFSVWESISSSSYERLLVHQLGYPAYQSHVLHGVVPRSYILHSTIGGLTVIRAGSLIPDPITLAFYSLIPLAFGVQLLGRDRLRATAFLGTAVAIALLVQAETRSALIGAVIVFLLSGWLAYRTQLAGRLRYVTITVVALLISLPLTVHTTFAHRVASIWTGSQSRSNEAHTTRSHSALREIVTHPAGQGLGANPSTGRRFSTGNFSGASAENTYLTTGLELGLAGMIVFVALYVFLLRELLRVARGPTGAAPTAAALWLAGGALLVGGFFLQLWLSIQVALTFWGLAGAALGAARHDTSGRHALQVG